MRSSSGDYFIGLDQVRALAAFLVVAWHFTHAANGYPVPFDYVPSIFPFALLAEGHTGVALFMTLSGYLFAKLLDGKQIDYAAFFWNRALRLLPLLIFVVAVKAVLVWQAGESLKSYAFSIAQGVLLPTMPNGGWSITVESHYYLVLPIFLWLLRRSRWLPLLIVAGAILLRIALYGKNGEIQSLAYWTIIGRIDQFSLGMMVFQFRGFFAGRHFLAAGVLTAFCLFYWAFDIHGGFYEMPTYPSPSPLWIVLPTIEGVAYAVGIAWYDSSFAPSRNGVSAFIARAGAYSYSIYLLHFFVVFAVARFVNEHVMNISNFYVACLWATAFFAAMVPIGHLSFRFIESPFLKLRKHYTLSGNRVAASAPASTQVGKATRAE